MKKAVNIKKRVLQWYLLSIAEVFENLKSDPDNGLRSKDVSDLFTKFGYNELPQKNKFSRLGLFFSQFNSVLMYILLGAAIMSFVLGEVVDTYIIVVAISVNVIVGYIQEYKAHNALAKLSTVIERFCVVIRDGKKQKIHARDLVPGDIIFISVGNIIPADARLMEFSDLEVNESMLTGESLPVLKNIEILNVVVPLGQRSNSVFMGTLVTRGSGRAIVVNTGLNTEMGGIAGLLKETKSEQTPLQKNLLIFSRRLGALILFMCALIFVVGIFSGKPFVEMFTVAVAAAVASIPEGLLIAVTVILALGMQRILKRNALVRKLVAAETLGSTTYVCSDKTGTLTEGVMTVLDFVTSKYKVNLLSYAHPIKEDVVKLIELSVLANNASLENPQSLESGWRFIGSPTEVAMLRAGYVMGKGTAELEKTFSILDQHSFTSERKYMIALHYDKNNNHNVLSVNGAPDRILSRSKYILEDGKFVFITEKIRQRLIRKHKLLTGSGLRVLGIGYSIVDLGIKKIDEQSLDSLTFVGYITISDPLRDGVSETIREAQMAGIRTVMITGDYKNTAFALACNMGLIKKTSSILTGEDVVGMSDAQLRRKATNVQVYARVTPYDKLRIVDALQARGHVVAMTGDGINDAPALQSADIGIAVGSGTDVTKDVADMVLLDNNFKTIISAIREGRVIMDNIKKVIVYLLADSMSALILVLGSLLFGLPLPITAAQILWINLVTDSFPSMALAFEPAEGDVMKLRPRKKNSGILDGEMKALIFIIGVSIDVVLLGLFYYYISAGSGIALARTVIFASLGVDTLLYAFSCKSLRRPLWKTNIFDNKYLLWAVMFGLFVQLSALYVPFLRTLLRLEFLGASDWILIGFLAIIKILGIEVVKALYRKSWR